MADSDKKHRLPSFASQLRREHIQKLSLSVPEDEYYKFYSEKPPVPASGHLMLQRRVMSNNIKVTWPDGQSVNIMMGPLVHLRFKQWMVPQERMDRALTYLWNFGTAIVVMDKDRGGKYQDSPPFKLPDHPKTSIW